MPAVLRPQPLAAGARALRGLPGQGNGRYMECARGSAGAEPRQRVRYIGTTTTSRCTALPGHLLLPKGSGVHQGGISRSVVAMMRLSARPYEFRLQTDLPMEVSMGYEIMKCARWVCRLLTGSNSRRTSSLSALLRRVQLVALFGFRSVSNPFGSEIPTRLLIR